jgi:hypothetical protein
MMDSHHEKFEALQRTLISWMKIHQTRTDATEEEQIAKMDAHQERMKANTNAWQKEETAC